MLKLCSLIVAILLVNYNIIKNRFISSSTIWIFCYILVLVCYPLLSPYSFYNEDKIDLFSFVGILTFGLGVYYAEKIRINVFSASFCEKPIKLPRFNVAVVMFILTYVISLICLYIQFGLSNVFSVIGGDLSSKKMILEGEGFLFGLSLLLPIPFLITEWIVSKTWKNRSIFFLTLVLYIIEFLLFGFTRIFLISAITIIFLHYLVYKKLKYQIILSSFMVVTICIVMTIMNYIRTFGISIDVDSMMSMFLNNPLEGTDFGASYYWLDILLNHEPLYINPIVYLKPILVWIPRELFELKPDPLSLQILKRIDPFLAASGYSTAGNSVLGEAYSVLGIFGIVLYPFFWGYICTRMDIKFIRLLESKETDTLWVLWYYIFEVFVVICCHRGDCSQYMTIVLWFFLLPIYIIAKFFNNKGSLKWVI